METTKLKVFQYVGSDDQIFEDIKTYFDELDDFSDVKKIYQYVNTSKNNWKDEFISAFEEGIPHIIYIDFCAQDIVAGSVESISEVILNYKKNYDYRNILVAGIFPDKEVLEDSMWMAFSGMNYIYIKSDKQSNMIYRDTRFMVLDNAVLFQDFAKASGVNLNYFGLFPGVITNFDEDYLTIECDMHFSEDSTMQANFNLFEEFNIKKVNVIEALDSSAPKFYLMHKYIAKIPYPEPFDDVEEDALYRDTFETWLDNNREEMCVTRLSILVLDNTFSHENICKLIMDTEVDVNYRDKFKPTHDYFYSNRPQIVFYSLDDDEEEDQFKVKIDDRNDTLKLTEIIESICTIEGYLPFVVIFNCPSTTEAFQKVFKYPNIIVHPDVIEAKTINMMVKLFKKKGRAQKVYDEQCYFDITRKNSWIGLHQDMYITSLTEHELTFLSKTELPLFSLIKMDVPCDLYLTLIPPITSLDPQRGYYHYMGFINGVTEKDLEKLRRFVNQLIKNHPQVYEYLAEPEDEEGEVDEDGNLIEGGETPEEVEVEKRPKKKGPETKVVRAQVEKMIKDDIKSKL